MEDRREEREGGREEKWRVKQKKEIGRERKKKGEGRMKDDIKCSFKYH